MVSLEPYSESDAFLVGGCGHVVTFERGAVLWMTFNDTRGQGGG